VQVHLIINLPASVHVSLHLADGVLNRACACANFAYSILHVILWILWLCNKNCWSFFRRLYTMYEGSIVAKINSESVQGRGPKS